MEDNELEILPEDMDSAPAEEVRPKSLFQAQKESWYDKIPLNLKQMDIIVAACWILLGITCVLIALEALDVFHLFG